jgi:hypothetical protein
MAAENRSYTLADMVNNAIICTLGARKLSDGTEMSKAPDFSKEAGRIDAKHIKTLRNVYNSRMKKDLEELLREYFTDNLDAVIKEGKYSNAMVNGAKGAWKPFPAETFEYMLKDGTKATGNGAAAIAMGARAGVYGLVKAEEKAIAAHVEKRKAQKEKGTAAAKPDINLVPNANPIPSRTFVMPAVYITGTTEDQRVILHVAALLGENIQAGGKTFYPDTFKNFVVRNMNPQSLERLRSAFGKEEDRKALFRFLYVSGASTAAYEILRNMAKTKDPAKEVAIFNANAGRSAERLMADPTYNKGDARCGRDLLGGETVALASTQEIAAARHNVESIGFHRNRINMDIGALLGRGGIAMSLGLDSAPRSMRKSPDRKNAYEFDMGRETLYIEVVPKYTGLLPEAMKSGAASVSIALEPKNRAAGKAKRVSFSVNGSGKIGSGKLVDAGSLPHVRDIYITAEGKRTAEYAPSAKQRLWSAVPKTKAVAVPKKADASARKEAAKKERTKAPEQKEMPVWAKGKEKSRWRRRD